jgi:hypothetical protein
MEIELQTNKAAESIIEHRFREIMISSPVQELFSEIGPIGPIR